MYIYMYLCINLVSYGWINVLLYERNQNLVVQYLCGLEFCKMYKFMKTVLSSFKHVRYSVYNYRKVAYIKHLQCVC